MNLIVKCYQYFYFIWQLIFNKYITSPFSSNLNIYKIYLHKNATKTWSFISASFDVFI